MDVLAMSLRLPSLLQEQMTAAREAGLYESETELAELDIVSLKRVLEEQDITRKAPESLAETIEMARASLQAAGRTT